MSVLVDKDTKLCVSGITGREGTFHALNNKRYGTNVVAGVTPGKGGQDVEGVPVFNTFHDAVGADRREHRDDLRAAALRRRLDPRGRRRRHRDDHLHHRGHPRPRRAARLHAPAAHPGARLIGPNCPGILSPGKANVGIIPASFFKEGNVGVVSRSGTLTYQIGNELAQRGFGNSSIVGIGGDPVPGSSFIDVIELFEADPETELIVMCGEIGGDAEERAAEYIAEHVTKPVVGYIAGFTAPPGKTMGHAGAIVSGSKGTAAAKAEALEAKGVRVGRTPTAGRRDRRRDPRRLTGARGRPPRAVPAGGAGSCRREPDDVTATLRSSSASSPRWSRRWPPPRRRLRRRPRPSRRPSRQRPRSRPRRRAAAEAAQALDALEQVRDRFVRAADELIAAHRAILDRLEQAAAAPEEPAVDGHVTVRDLAGRRAGDAHRLRARARARDGRPRRRGCAPSRTGARCSTSSCRRGSSSGTELRATAPVPVPRRPRRPRPTSPSPSAARVPEGRPSRPPPPALAHHAGPRGAARARGGLRALPRRAAAPC